MSLVETRVGKKGAIYLPKHVLEKLGVKPGDRVIISIIDSNKVLLEFIPDPLSLAIHSKKWCETSVEEFERESEEEQAELYES